MPVFARQGPIERIVWRGGGLGGEDDVAMTEEVRSLVVGVGFDQVRGSWEEVNVGSRDSVLHLAASNRNVAVENSSLQRASYETVPLFKSEAGIKHAT